MYELKISFRKIRSRSVKTKKKWFAHNFFQGSDANAPKTLKTLVLTHRIKEHVVHSLHLQRIEARTHLELDLSLSRSDAPKV